LRRAASDQTDLGVFQPTGDGFRTVERASGVTHGDAQACTGAPVS